MENIGRSFALITLKLRGMSQRERGFWRMHGGGLRSNDRATRQHLASYGKRRAVHGLSQWRALPC